MVLDKETRRNAFGTAQKDNDLLETYSISLIYCVIRLRSREKKIADLMMYMAKILKSFLSRTKDSFYFGRCNREKKFKQKKYYYLP